MSRWCWVGASWSNHASLERFANTSAPAAATCRTSAGYMASKQTNVPTSPTPERSAENRRPASSAAPVPRSANGRRIILSYRRADVRVAASVARDRVLNHRHRDLLSCRQRLREPPGAVRERAQQNEREAGKRQGWPSRPQARRDDTGEARVAQEHEQADAVRA